MSTFSILSLQGCGKKDHCCGLKKKKKKANTRLSGKQKYQPSRKVSWEMHASHQLESRKMSGCCFQTNLPDQPLKQVTSIKSQKKLRSYLIVYILHTA